jgi:hypothetical protein
MRRTLVVLTVVAIVLGPAANATAASSPADGRAAHIVISSFSFVPA